MISGAYDGAIFIKRETGKVHRRDETTLERFRALKPQCRPNSKHEDWRNIHSSFDVDTEEQYLEQELCVACFGGWGDESKRVRELFVGFVTSLSREPYWDA